MDLGLRQATEPCRARPLDNRTLTSRATLTKDLSSLVSLAGSVTWSPGLQTGFPLHALRP